MLCITEKICKEILKCYDTNLCKMGSFAVRKTLMCRTDQLKKNLRFKYSYGINDKSRDEETNILVGLQFPSINRGVARTAWPRPTSVPAAKTAYAFFEQTYLINCMVLSCHVRALE